MEFIGRNTIKLDKVPSELDIFVTNFIKILEKHTAYVIVSGYVAILLGRERGTDDIDIIIPKKTKTRFLKLYASLIKEGYWCLNSSEFEDAWGLLSDSHSIRFAAKQQTSPNIEIKFSRNIFDKLSLKNKITLIIGKIKLKISQLEIQIAYKEEVLKSNKDMEDARHIRLIAKNYLNKQMIDAYKIRLKGK